MTMNDDALISFVRIIHHISRPDHCMIILKRIGHVKIKSGMNNQIIFELNKIGKIFYLLNIFTWYLVDRFTCQENARVQAE